MSRVREAFTKHIQEQFGEHAKEVIDFLFASETLDDQLARDHMIKVELFLRRITTKDSTLQIQEGIAIDYGVSRSRVRDADIERVRHQ